MEILEILFVQGGIQVGRVQQPAATQREQIPA